MRIWQKVFVEESNRLKNRHPLVRWVVQTVQTVQRPINVVTESRVREQWRFYYDYDRRGNEVTVSTLSQLSVLIAIIRLCVVAQRKITKRYTALFLNHRVNIFIYFNLISVIIRFFVFPAKNHNFNISILRCSFEFFIYQSSHKEYFFLS